MNYGVSRSRKLSKDGVDSSTGRRLPRNPQLWERGKKGRMFIDFRIMNIRAMLKIGG